MRIESDTPIHVVNPQLSIEVHTGDNRHASTPLDYETWSQDFSSEVRVKGYDAAGASVIITINYELLLEMAFGRIAP